MKVADFEKKHGLCRNNISVSIHQKNIPDIRVKVEGEGFYIDETFFIRRKEFARKVQLFNHDMYYLLSNYKADLVIAKGCARHSGNYDNFNSLNTFINKGLFKLPIKSIVNYKITGQMWLYFRYFTSIHRDLKRKLFQFDIQIPLDRMM